MEPITVTADAEEFTCNAYLVPGDAPTLVDAGAMPGVADVVAEHVDDLDRVVLTHQHGDHVGELDAVLDRFDATLLAYGTHPRRDVAIEDGDEVLIGDEPCEVVYTPGHAADHVAFMGENGSTAATSWCITTGRSRTAPSVGRTSTDSHANG